MWADVLFLLVKSRLKNPDLKYCKKVVLQNILQQLATENVMDSKCCWFTCESA